MIRYPETGGRSRVFMFPKSRRLVFAFCLYFFSVGALDTYARCMEDSEAFGIHTEVLARENLISHAGSEFFHCPDELNIYRLAERRYTPQRNITVKASLENTRIGESSLSSNSFFRRTPPGQLFPLFLYPAVHIYQSKVVYRI